MIRTICWISLVACAVTALPAAAAAKPVPSTDCTLKRYASVDLSVTPGSVRVPVTIDNETEWMALNLQSSLTVMSKAFAARKGFVVKDIPGRQTLHFGPQQVTQYAVIHSFAIGTLEFQTAEFLLVPQWGLFSPVAATIGGLGFDVLRKTDVEIDFRNKKLNLYSQDHCPGAGVYWAKSYAFAPMRRGVLGNAFLPFELDGKKIQATLSTSTLLTSLPTDLTKRMYGFDEHSPGIETETDASGHTTSQYRAMAITAPGLRLNNTRVRLDTRRSSCGLDVYNGPDRAAQYTECVGSEAPLRIGLDVLEKLHLYFATKENVLYYTAADAGFEAADTRAGDTAAGDTKASLPGTPTAQ
jgi:hypothetical protein